MVKISPSNARNVGSIPGQGAEIPHAVPPERSKHKNNPKKSKHKNKRQYCNTFNKYFKNDPHQKILKKKNPMMMDFPGGPAVKTLQFHCRRHEFHPWSGKNHRPCSAPKRKKSNDKLLKQDLQN